MIITDYTHLSENIIEKMFLAVKYELLFLYEFNKVMDIAQKNVIILV